MLHRAFWIPGSVLLLSLFHLGVLSAASRNPAQIWGAVVLSFLLVLWLNRRRMANSLRHIPALATAVLIIVTVADLLINLVPFEPRKYIGSAYRILLNVLIYCLPLTVVWLSRRRRFRPLLPAAGMTVLLLPPFSYELNTAFQAPFYGRITGLLYLLLLWRRIRFTREDLILLLPALAAVPALFYGHSPGNTFDHIQIWLLFGATAIYIRHMKQSKFVLLSLTLPLSLIHALFVFLFPEMHSINSNVTAMLVEAMMVIGFVYILSGKQSIPVSSAISILLFIFVLVLCLRIDSQTGTVVVLFSGAVYLGFYVIQPRLSKLPWLPLRSLLLPAGTVLTVVLAAAYLGFVDTSKSIAARRLVWEVTIAGITDSPVSLLTGNGDFGPFHMYLFRHFRRALSNHELQILRGEPYLLSQHPHNDILFMVYGGGILLLGIMIWMTVKLLRDSQRLSLAYKTGGIAFVAAMVMHGLTEPFSTGVTTGFLFFLAFALFTEPGKIRRSAPKGSPVLAGLALYLLLLAFIQIPVTRFWRQNNNLFYALRKNRSFSVESVKQEELDRVESRLRTLILLAPFESDYYRQAGDVARLRSIAGLDNDLAQAERFYCQAFALRSSPLHYASIRRVKPDLSDACQGFSLRQDLQSFDPQGLLDLKLRGAPLF